MTRDSILIVDFGSQFTHLIARRFRELGVYSEIIPPGTPLKTILAYKPKGLVLSGGPSSVYQQGAPRCHPEIFSMSLPVLGICYGMQLMCDVLGGKVSGSASREFGRAHLTIVHPDPLLEGVSAQSQVWMSHGDQVQSISDQFVALAKTGISTTGTTARR